jgi:hypothetical protein
MNIYCEIKRIEICDDKCKRTTRNDVLSSFVCFLFACLNNNVSLLFDSFGSGREARRNRVFDRSDRMHMLDIPGLVS